MENNQPQKLYKKSFIKKELKKIIGLVILVVIGVYIQHGYMPIKIVVVVLGTMISLMLLSSFLLFKYPDIFKYMRRISSRQEYNHAEQTKIKEEVSKKQFIKIILANTGMVILFVWFLFFVLYIFLGTSIPVLALVIASGCFLILIPIVILSQIMIRK